MKYLQQLVVGTFWLFFVPVATAGNGQLTFGGVGIDGVPLPNGQIEVRQLVYGGPAHRAGVKIGDIICLVDKVPTQGSNFHHIVETRFKGRAGTFVLLTVQRKGTPALLHFRIRRVAMKAAVPNGK